MKTQFHQSVVYALLIAAVVAISGCSYGIKYYELAEIAYHEPKVNFKRGKVGGNCGRTGKVVKEISERKFYKLPRARIEARYEEHEYLSVGERACAAFYNYRLDFSLIQLDDDVISITTKDKSRENVDKYTLLVVAKKGLHDGFKYARFEGSESRDETEHVPLTTTTESDSDQVSSGFSAYRNFYGSAFSIGSSSSRSETTTSGGYTKTTSYGRNHTVKYFKQKVAGAFNLQAVAESINRQDGFNWRVIGLD